MVELLILGGLAALIGKAISSAGSGSSSSSSGVRGSARGRYDFDYRKVDGEWRAYILRQPAYRGRPTDGHSTHRYHDDSGHYVCWSEPIESLEECRAVARLWSEMTDDYIENGSEF